MSLNEKGVTFFAPLALVEAFNEKAEAESMNKSAFFRKMIRLYLEEGSSNE